EIEFRRGSNDSVRPSQTMRNWRAHIGRTELRHHRAIGELDHSMNDRLRMNENVDLFRGQTKQACRLDYLETLIHHRCRIDCDLLSHAPVRMLERLLQRCLFDTGSRPGAERPA